VIRVDEDIGYVRVAGVSHRQEALEKCAAGQSVRFVHEPDNPHDEAAIRVNSLTGETIGYLPRASWIHQMVHERGRGISGTIASMGYSRNCLLGATLSVVICDDEIAVESYYPAEPAPEPPKGGYRYWIKTPSDVWRVLKSQRERALPNPIRHPQYQQHSGTSG
jgi:hypothetical protein